MLSLRLSRLVKPATVRSSLLLSLTSSGFSTTSSVQTPPFSILHARPCGADLGKLIILTATEDLTTLDKTVPLELMKEMVMIGASHGWIATLKEDGIMRLQDDLNPVASDSDPKHIPLPPLVTLPHCQTQVVTNVAMSSSSPEHEDCVVAVKFLGPQLSLYGMFRIPGSGGNLIGSWDLHKHKKKPKIQRLQFKNLPELTKTKRELLHSCCTSQHLVESTTTDETFLVRWYRKATSSGVVKMKTKAAMVFKLDEEGNAVYTEDIGHLCIFLSKSEPFCVPANSIPGMCPNIVDLFDFDESATFGLDESSLFSYSHTYPAPYHIPPQTILD
ncbi:hypothetical protein AXX17_AT5G51810 [Arabidopsis thaliana]|uniref:KIB1-4 beta-propeller domain-containing protein n=2 Tax=Arabidopsis thaliana TaxID=3702 RepID=A0A178UCU4_ARATH|nr:hypothetical protein AXX17_AT5G51810 [Arabidopsis thaliana]